MFRLKSASPSLIDWLNRLFSTLFSTLFSFGLLSLLLGVAACGPLQRADLQSAPSNPPLASVPPSPAAASAVPSAVPSAAPSANATPSAELIADLKARVSQEFGIAEPQLQVQESQPVDWSDSCLGAAAAGEMCAQMITPGYRIVLSSGTEQFEFHTDQRGRSVRLVR